MPRKKANIGSIFSVFAFSCVQCNVMSAIIVYIFLSQWHNWQLQSARAHSSRSGEFELKTIGHEYKQCVLCCLSFWVACATERMHTWLTNKANAGNLANRKKNCEESSWWTSWCTAWLALTLTRYVTNVIQLIHDAFLSNWICSSSLIWKWTSTCTNDASHLLWLHAFEWALHVISIHETKMTVTLEFEFANCDDIRHQ